MDTVDRTVTVAVIVGFIVVGSGLSYCGLRKMEMDDAFRRNCVQSGKQWFADACLDSGQALFRLP